MLAGVVFLNGQHFKGRRLRFKVTFGITDFVTHLLNMDVIGFSMAVLGRANIKDGLGLCQPLLMSAPLGTDMPKAQAESAPV